MIHTNPIYEFSKCELWCDQVLYSINGWAFPCGSQLEHAIQIGAASIFLLGRFY